MTCWIKPKKKLWEDWQFFFKIQNEDWTFQNLQNYSFWFIIENKKREELINDSFSISDSIDEVIKTVSADTTKNYKAWHYYVQFKVINASWETFLTDKAEFYAESSLFTN